MINNKVFKHKCLNPIPLKVYFKRDFNIPNYSDIEGSSDYEKFLDIENKKEGNILAPCGKCYICLKNRVSEWFIRLLTEYQTNYNGTFMLFVTLTYNNENLGDKSLDYRDIQLFMKRLRKYYKDYKIKFMCVGEYGFKSFRKHWHLILLGFEDLEPHYKYHIQSLWNKGFAVTKVCDENTVFYLLKYSFKQRKYPRKWYIENGYTPPLFRVSQSFGKDFALNNKDTIIRDGYLSYLGFYYKVPRYFTKLFRKLNLIDGWELMNNTLNSLKDYIISCLKYYNIGDFDIGNLSFSSLKNFVSLIHDNFNEKDYDLFHKFYLDFKEAV